MRFSIFLLPVVGALFAHACDSEIPCSWTSNSTTLKKRDAPVHVASYKTWAASPNSCWSDIVDGLRALDCPAQGLDSNNLTVEACLDACEAQGYYLAGVEWSRECYCGNTLIGNNRPIADSNCNYPCTGNPTEDCGGSAALNLYIRDNYQFTIGPASVVSSYNGYSVTECWDDYISYRILPSGPQPPLDAHQMTVPKCIDACAAAGYTSAGVEYGRECYCGNVTYPPSQSEPISECNMACLGDATQICGAGNLMLIYHKDQPVTTYKGIIQVSNAADNSILGYLSKNSFSLAQFRYEPTVATAMVVTFQLTSGATSGSDLRFTSTNSDTGYPLLGLIQGRDDSSSLIQAGSYQYGYFGGVTPVPPMTPPQNGDNSYTHATGLARTFESDVWSVNLATGAVMPQWINPAGVGTATEIFTQSTALYFGGDEVAFNNKYPAPVLLINLKFIPTP